MINSSGSKKIKELKVVSIEELLKPSFNNSLEAIIAKVINDKLDYIIQTKADELKGKDGVSVTLEECLPDLKKYAKEAVSNLRFTKELSEALSRIDNMAEAKLGKKSQEVGERLMTHFENFKKEYVDPLKKEITAYNRKALEDLESKVVAQFDDYIKSSKKIIKGYAEEAKELLNPLIEEVNAKVAEKLNSISIDYDKLKNTIDLESLKGKDAELDQEAVNSKLAELFNSWKPDIKDLKGEKGDSGTEFPTHKTKVAGTGIALIGKFPLEQSNYLAILQVSAIGQKGSVLSVDHRVFIQNFAKEGNIALKESGSYFPVNTKNLNYSFEIKDQFLEVKAQGCADEEMRYTVTLRKV